MENIDAEQQLLENNLDGIVNKEEQEDPQQSEQCTNEQTDALNPTLERSASTRSEMTRQLSDCLLTQLMGSVGGEQIVQKTQELPYEGQVYINNNISLLREKFHEFVSKYADPENP